MCMYGGSGGKGGYRQVCVCCFDLVVFLYLGGYFVFWI